MAELTPVIGTRLTGEGSVTRHERVTDSTGRFYGLLRLVVDNPDGTPPNADLWCQLLPAQAITHYAYSDYGTRGRRVILYKLPGEIS